MSLPFRTLRLRAYDAARREFIDDCAARAGEGAALGSEDVRTLEDLASEIVGAVMAWSAVFTRLDLARDARGRRPAEFSGQRAGRLVLEAVFDELLTPSAWRLLAAGLSLVESDA